MQYNHKNQVQTDVEAISRIGGIRTHLNFNRQTKYRTDSIFKFKSDSPFVGLNLD